MAVLTMREFDLKHTAADVVLDIIGAENPNELVSANVLSAGHIEELKALQALIFDHDEQGSFIRDNVSFLANGKPLNPDVPMNTCFAQADKDGTKYMHCDLVVSNQAGSSSNSAPAAAAAAATNSMPEQINAFARIMFLHQLAIGFQIDVTKEFPEMSESIADAEKNNWIQIDVKKAAYVLTPDGKRVHDSFVAEAQDLIKRFDIYGDVDIDGSGAVRFDSGLGKDLRIPVYEFEGIDPFRARFLIGINDGEWDQLSNWFELYRDEKWYQTVFAPVENAPSVDDIGKDIVRKVTDCGKAELRQDSQFN